MLKQNGAGDRENEQTPESTANLFGFIQGQRL
jgi:hypothetical protein